MNVVLSDSAKKIIIWVIAMVLFMEMLDATVLNVALPQIAKSLHDNPIELKAALTAYLLTLGIFMPMTPWAVDRLGESKVMTLAILVFILSSIGCAASTNLSMMIIFRCLQGMGGAFLTPVGRIMLVRVFEGDTVTAMAKVATAVLVGLMFGPLVGGILTTYASWRWIFILNVPFGLVAMYFIYRYLPALTETKHVKFDWLGFVLMGAALGSLLFLLDIVTNASISVTAKILFFLFSVGVFITYLMHSRRSEAPLINPEIFSSKLFRVASWGSFLSRLSLSAQPFLVPLLLQSGYGYSAVVSGLYATPMLFGALLSKRFISRLLSRFGYRKIILLSTGLSALLFAMYAGQTFLLLPGMLIVQQFFMGFIVSSQFTAMNSFAYDQLHPAHVSMGASFYSAIIQLSGSFGIALAALTMIACIGRADLTHAVPLMAFRVVFIVQALYLVIAGFVYRNI